MKRLFRCIGNSCRSHANEHYPIFPGRTKVVHVGFEHPPELAKDMPDGEAKPAVYRRVSFEQVHGTCNCRRLLGGRDLRTPAGMQRFKEQDLHRKVCVSCVRTVGDILAGLLEAPAAT